MNNLRLLGAILICLGIVDVLFWYWRATPIYIEQLGYIPTSFFLIPIVTLGILTLTIGFLTILTSFKRKAIKDKTTTT